MSTSLIIILCVIAVGLLIPDNRKARKWFCIAIGLVFILQNALRGLHYLDTYNYYVWYQSIASESLSSIFKDFSFFGTSYEHRDLGYPLFVKLTQYIYTDFTFFQFVVAIIIIVPLMYLVYKLSPSNAGVITACSVFESLYAGFFMTGMRQTIVMGMVLLAYNWVLKDDKKWKFIVVVALASTIHTTAWVFLPAAFINYVKNPKKTMLLMLIAMPVIMVFAKQIIAFLGAGTMYSSYAVDSKNNLGTPVFSALLTMIGILVYLASDKIVKKYPQYANTYILMIGCAVVLMPSSWVDSNFLRIVDYYSIFMLVSIPVAIECLFSKSVSNQRLAYIIANGVLILLQIMKS